MKNPRFKRGFFMHRYRTKEAVTFHMIRLKSTGTRIFTAEWILPDNHKHDIVEPNPSAAYPGRSSMDVHGI